jgi:PelA/Pel-15E family pectate lyase
MAWPQQLDPLTLKPCAARNFEPISECSNESVGLTLFLMSIPQPSRQISAAIDGAMAWFKQRALHGVTWDRNATAGTGLVEKPGAPELWARFYEIGTGRPVFGDRDRTIHYAVTEISEERRHGYGWFNNRATELPAAYAKWSVKRIGTFQPPPY